MEWGRIEEKWLKMTVRLQGVSAKPGQAKSAQINTNPIKSPPGGQNVDSGSPSDDTAMGDLSATKARAMA